MRHYEHGPSADLRAGLWALLLADPIDVPQMNAGGRQSWDLQYLLADVLTHDHEASVQRWPLLSDVYARRRPAFGVTIEPVPGLDDPTLWPAKPIYTQVFRRGFTLTAPGVNAGTFADMYVAAQAQYLGMQLDEVEQALEHNQPEFSLRGMAHPQSFMAGWRWLDLAIEECDLAELRPWTMIASGHDPLSNSRAPVGVTEFIWEGGLAPTRAKATVD